MKIETINGFTTVVLEQYENLAWEYRSAYENAPLVARNLSSWGNHYYIVKCRYPYEGMPKTMFTQEEFSVLKTSLVDTYGEAKLTWYNIRNEHGNTGWEAKSRHSWQSGTPRHFRYCQALKDDTIIWKNYSTSSFKIPSTFLSHEVDKMKDTCQICENTFDNSIRL